MAEILLEVDYKPFGVPYMRTCDEQSHSYLDLRAEPERIAELPEPANWPELKSALEAINDAESGFQTLGCAEWYPKIIPDHPPLLVAYVDFCFHDLPLNRQVMNCYGQFHQFTEYVQTNGVPDDLDIRWTFRQTVFNSVNVVGWSMSYWVRGFGESREEARELPNAGLRMLTDFLALMSRRLNEG